MSYCSPEGFKIKVLDCIISRRRVTMRPSPSGIAKNVILEPLALCPAALFLIN
jgi:hypothetical protein